MQGVCSKITHKGYSPRTITVQDLYHPHNGFRALHVSNMLYFEHTLYLL